MSDDGANLIVRAGQQADQPMMLVHRSGLRSDHGSTTTNVVVLEPDSRATLVELFDERIAADRAPLCELRIRLGARSRLVHYRLAAASHRSPVLDTLQVDVAAAAEYEQYFLAAPGAAFRSTQTVRLAGDRAKAAFSAACVAVAGANVELHTLFIHDGSRTSSDQHASVIGLDAGRATLNCETQVPAGKKGIRAEQLLRAMQFGRKTDLSLRPRLSILSDDVVCHHGATTAAVSPQELHYLRSRGIPEREALACLAEAFLRARLPVADAGPVGALMSQIMAGVLDAVRHIHAEAAR
jgi:Fe-S cluster assembly protein SufD